MRRQHAAAVLTLKHEPCWIAVATVDINSHENENESEILKKPRNI